jgi:hypothetical protein
VLLLEAVAVPAAAAPADEFAEEVPAAPPEPPSAAAGALPEAVAVALPLAALLPAEPFPDD